MQLLDIIKEQCDEQNLSIAALERMAGVGNGTIGRWDESKPNLASLTKVADALGKPLEYFLKGFANGVADES